MGDFIIIDAYNFLFRSYYALPPMEDSQNNPLGGIYGFCSMILKYLSEHKAKYVVVACDSGKELFRNKIYPAYKANRPETPEGIVRQFPIMRDAIKAFGLCNIEIEGWEADDIIASLVVNYSNNLDGKMIILSSDKDLMQLIGPKVVMFDIMKDKYITPAEVQEKLGVPPLLVSDYLALCGDASDNVPGVKGIGPKTAALLLKEYGSLKAIFENLDQLHPIGRRKTLLENQKNAEISFELVKLKGNAQLSHDLADFIFAKPDRGVLLNFFDRYDFRSLKTRAQKLLFDDQISTPEAIVFSAKEVWIDSLECASKVIISKVTDGILLYSDQGTAFLVSKIEDCIQMLEKPYLLKIGYDLKSFDYVFNQCDDLMLIAYSIYTQKISFAQLMQDEFQENMSKPPNALENAKLMLRLHNALKHRLLQNKLYSLYFRLELPLVSILKRIESVGIKVNKEALKDLSNEYRRIIASLEKEIYHLAGGEFNVGSPKQMADILFRKLNLPRNNARSDTTNHEVLEELALFGHTIASKILEWRHYSKLASTYTEALVKHINPETARVHTCYNLASTSTGRLSSTNPNLQNIPIRNTNKIRACFIAEPGKILISADYSQIELRLLSHIADIKEMKSALEHGEDIHSTTASTIFGLPVAEIIPEMRSKAKAINFGIIYGITSYGLARQLKIPVTQAEIYIKEYLAKYPGIAHYMECAKDQARKFGYISTLFGRRCLIPNINSSNSVLRKIAERAAINAPIQGSAADIMRLALVELAKKCHPAEIVMQIHDEFVLEAPDSAMHTVAKLVRKIMEGVLREVILKVDISAGPDLAKMQAI